ncbi:pyrimidine/purine nucleoside phosphorylase [Pseudomonadota bacterium]|nr:pyrimidine/purine nucleoside phosphorylase [Pseudomonadota bacterium]
MNTFKNVTVDKLANIYFEGKVISRKIIFDDGTIKTLGVMLPGEYEFKTQSKELMEIISGELNFQLKDKTNWNIIKDGMSFNVEKDSSFKVKVFKTVNYSCSYFD